MGINKDEIKEENTITEGQVINFYDKMQEKYNEDNKDVLEKTESEELPQGEIETDILGSAENFVEDMRSIGLSEEVINDLKDIEAKDVDMDKVEEDESQYDNIFSAYGISDEEAEILLNTIRIYKQNPNINVDELELPKTIKNLIPGLAAADPSNRPINAKRKDAIKMLLGSLINDAKINTVLDEYVSEMNNAFSSINKEFQGSINKSIEEIFNDIDKIEAENPEQAKSVRAIKKAFEDSLTFDKQLNYLNNTTAKKIDKVTKRYEGEFLYFDKRSNSFNIIFPRMNNVYNVLKKAYQGFTSEQIVKFLVVFIKSTYNMNMDKLEDVAYVYRALSNIMALDYTIDVNEDTYTKVTYENVEKVIKKIIEL